MGFFDNILAKLGMNKAEATETTETQATPEVAAPEATEAISFVDVLSQLEQRAEDNEQDLNWQDSIVDLLKLLELDSSFAARKELAVELNCPAELMKDSAEMNIWLHKTVLAKIAANGGNIPQELLV